jgi:hypothetical protein
MASRNDGSRTQNRRERAAVILLTALRIDAATNRVGISSWLVSLHKETFLCIADAKKWRDVSVLTAIVYVSRGRFFALFARTTKSLFYCNATAILAGNLGEKPRQIVDTA